MTEAGPGALSVIPKSHFFAGVFVRRPFDPWAAVNQVRQRQAVGPMDRVPFELMRTVGAGPARLLQQQPEFRALRAARLGCPGVARPAGGQGCAYPRTCPPSIPRLTTVSGPAEALGRESVELLLRGQGGHAAALAPTTVVQPRLLAPEGAGRSGAGRLTPARTCAPSPFFSQRPRRARARFRWRVPRR